MPQGSSQEHSPPRRSKVSLKDLIEAGLLRAGQELHFARHQDVRAKVTSRGTLMFNGIEYTSPSSAASDVNGTSLNGWTAWVLTEGSTRIKLADLRNRMQH